MTAAAVTVVVVDDHELFRSGVVAELGNRVRVVAEAGDIAEAVNAIAATTPDVVLLDVHLPSGSGREVIQRTGNAGSHTRFLALSVSDAAEDVIDLVRAGARGYVTKSIRADDLVTAIEQVAAGDAVFSPRLAGFVLDAFAATHPGADDPGLDTSPTANARSCAFSPAATRTRRSGSSSASPSRPSNRTPRPYCASSSSRAAAR